MELTCKVKKKRTEEIQLGETEKKGHLGYQITVDLGQNSRDRGSRSDSPEGKSRI